MPINDEKTLRLKLNQLNEIFLEVKAYKQAHPEARCGYYPLNYGSLLNAYREGDVGFDECIELLKAIPVKDETLRMINDMMLVHGTDERPLVEIPGTLKGE